MKPEVLIVGGGMITHDQILPSLYHLQRLGRIGEISVCSQRRETVAGLAAAEDLTAAFPGQSFRAYSQPDVYGALIARLPPRNIVVAAVPDQLHHDVVMTALRHDQHVCVVKPLVLTHAHAVEIEREAY